MANICKHCGAMNGEQAMACSRCHKPLQVVNGGDWQTTNFHQQGKAKSSKAGIVAAAGIIALVVIVTVIVILVVNHGKNEIVGKWSYETGKYIIFDADGTYSSPGGLNSMSTGKYEIDGSKLIMYSRFDSSEDSEWVPEEYEYEIQDNILKITSSSGKSGYYTKVD